MLKHFRMIALAGACALLVSGAADARQHTYHSYSSHRSSSSDYYTAHSGHCVHR